MNLTTPDPQFDPNAPITVNGYRYVPAAAVGRELARVKPNRERALRRAVADDMRARLGLPKAEWPE